MITPKGGQGQVRIRSVQTHKKSTGKKKLPCFSKSKIPVCALEKTPTQQVQGGVMGTKDGFATEN